MSESNMNTEEELIAKAYQAFNARDIDAVLAVLSPQVVWANGMEGGHVHGIAAVRDYWNRQWQVIDPHVEPLSITRQPDEMFLVMVHQVVRDKDGVLLADQKVAHLYVIENGLVQRMDIVPE
jgi:hypothetical protein